MNRFEQQLQRFHSSTGSFVAALDQSGGSTPKALSAYGITQDAWSTETGMFDMVHAMRTRVLTSPAFNGERILAAILFENTVDRTIEGQPTADYLWDVKGVVPILKADRGLMNEQDGVQCMKPMLDLPDLLQKAIANHLFGTKMRSVIRQANKHGISSVLTQQFDLGQQISAAGLVPILEPEVDIHCPHKAKAEALLVKGLIRRLDQLDEGVWMMLKLTPPEHDNLYADCIAHPNVLKVVCLSGGYSREEANARLARQHGMVASFSRALLEGLSVNQSDEAFNAMLDASIESIFQASQR